MKKTFRLEMSFKKIKYLFETAGLNILSSKYFVNQS